MKCNHIKHIIITSVIFLIGVLVGAFVIPTQDENINIEIPKIGQTCEYKGETYKIGEGFKDECNTCSCSKQGVVCTLIACNVN